MMSSSGSPPVAAPVEVRFHLPAGELRPLVTSYYAVEVHRGPLVDYLHPEWGNVRFILDGVWTRKIGARPAWVAGAATLYGPTDRTGVVETQGGALLGFGLTPLGWAQIVRRDAEALANGALPLSDIVGEAADNLQAAFIAEPDEAARVGLLNTALLRRLTDAPPVDDAVVAVSQALVSLDLPDTVAFAEAIGVSTRTLDRLCRRVFGFAPKRLLRRQRFLRTLDSIRDRLDRPLGEMIDHGYHDQALFIRDFRSYMGMTPSAYYASPREAMRRAAQLRSQAIGGSVQGVHAALDDARRQT